ncbi:secreted frizzled-related protein 2-like [Branchiostoma lanceolatum]|uniref:secreted frizzled-related protein 2-like n=1 Tax=Branchiostoma lanceolatum TaxID=7740 RepID=UPI003451E524
MELRLPNLMPLVAAAMFLTHCQVQCMDYGYGERIYNKQPQCTPIPSELTLCRNIAYSQMRLPNLLGHETMTEVLDQAVCLEHPIYPCRSLCEAVRDGCSPVMLKFGFPWPDMLRCDKFPPDNDLCITTQSGEVDPLPPEVDQPQPVCMACQSNGEGWKDLVGYYCQNDFVIRAKIEQIKITRRDTKIVVGRRKRVMKKTGIRKRDMRNLTLMLQDSDVCTCDEIQDTKSQFLIMGKKVDKQFIVTVIRQWKRSKDFRKASRSFKKGCQDNQREGNTGGRKRGRNRQRN